MVRELSARCAEDSQITCNRQIKYRLEHLNFKIFVIK